VPGDIGKEQSNMSETAQGGTDQPHRVVVVVDDTLGLREVYAGYLEQEGFTVALAANGVEAMLQIRRLRPSTVVLDLLMPRLGGLGTLEEIKAFDPSIRVVVVTGSKDAALREQAIALGANVFLTKPVKPEALISAITSDA
jgi:CheY-like chemotaxis protein